MRHLVEKHIHAGWRELSTDNASGVHRRVHVDVVLARVGEQAIQRRNARGVGAVDFHDAKDVPASHVRYCRARPIRTGVDHNRRIHTDGTVVNVQASDGDGGGETVIHIEDDRAGSDRARLWITIHLDVDQRGTFGIDRDRRIFEGRTHDRTEDQAACLKLSAHESTWIYRGVNVDVVI